MSSLKRKLLVAGVVVAAAISYLAFAGARQGWVYYVPVDQYVADSSQHAKRVRLMGTVAAEGIDLGGAKLAATFTLLGQEGKGSVRVHYRGAVPDMFKAGGDVVVEGKLDQAGVFQADVLLTKCASKYDPKHPGAAPGGAPGAPGVEGTPGAKGASSTSAAAVNRDPRSGR